MVGLSPTQTFLRYAGGCTSCSSPSSTAYKHDMPTTTETSQLVWNCNSVSSQHSSQHSSHTLRSRKLQDGTPQTREEKISNTACFCLISAVNYNLLAYFLIANLFTGVVNLSLETIKASPTTAFVVMNGYLLVLHAVITALYRRRILLKF